MLAMKKTDETNIRDSDVSDISEDPTLSSLNDDLNSVLSFTDNRLTAFLVALGALVYLLDYFKAPEAVMFMGAVICVAGIIAYTMFSVFRGQQRVAEKYGLVCNVCGWRPRTSQILLVAQTQQCNRCGNHLHFRKPRKK